MFLIFVYWKTQINHENIEAQNNDGYKMFLIPSQAQNNDEYKMFLIPSEAQNNDEYKMFLVPSE